MAQRINIEGMENLRPGEGVQVDKDTKYEYGATLESDKAQVIDTGVGKQVLIRTFDFKMNPTMKYQEVDKQGIFNAHAKQIATLLWADGLKPLESYSPRVIINPAKETYQIFVTCEAKLGTVFADKTRNLSEELAKSNQGKLDTPTA